MRQDDHHESHPERIELAPGLRISRVLTGLWQIADMERDGTRVDPEFAAAAMDRYVEAGLTTFDMADHYGSAEDITGHFRSTRSEPIQALTKWVPKPGPVTRAEVRAAVELSLRRMRSERLDLLQFHTWAYDDPSWLDALFYLEELRAEGLITAIGLTNFDAAHLEIALASGIRIASNQVSFSLIDRRAAGPLSEVCARHGVRLLAYGTVAGGLLTERWLGKPEPAWDDSATWSVSKYRRFIEVAGGWAPFQDLLATISSVARRHGVSMAAVASRFILDQPAVAGVIVGARLGRSEHIEDTLRLFRLRLDAGDRERLLEAAARLRPIPGDSGDEYRKPPYLTASGDLSHHLHDMPVPYPVRETAPGRTAVATGTGWEAIAGYARAVRVGDRIVVSGTTALHGGRLIGGEDAAAQTHFVLDKIEGTLRSLGGSLQQVIRTRIFVAREDHVEAVARAHGRRFGSILPANTLVVAGIVGAGELVEIEAEAVADPPANRAT